MTRTRYAVTWTVMVEATDADEAVDVAIAAMPSIAQRQDLQQWQVRAAGAGIGQTIDRRPVWTPHQVPLITVLTAEAQR
jgi:hypothetical protein